MCGDGWHAWHWMYTITPFSMCIIPPGLHWWWIHHSCTIIPLPLWKMNTNKKIQKEKHLCVEVARTINTYHSIQLLCNPSSWWIALAFFAENLLVFEKAAVGCLPFELLSFSSFLLMWNGTPNNNLKKVTSSTLVLPHHRRYIGYTE